jgi:hypothetical protein
MRRKEEVSLALIDTITFSIAKSLDHLGHQGQVLLDKVGEEIVNYLVEKGEIRDTDDPFTMISRLDKYFNRHGYRAKRKVRFEKDEMILELTPEEWTFSETWKELRNKQCALLSCPLCLANDSMLRRSGYGLVFTVALEDKGKIIQRSKLVDLRKKVMVKRALPAVLTRRLRAALRWT